jgi:hypothetical protein
MGRPLAAFLCANASESTIFVLRQSRRAADSG